MGVLFSAFEGCFRLSARLGRMIDTIIYEANDWFGNRTGNEILFVIITVYLKVVRRVRLSCRTISPS